MIYTVKEMENCWAICSEKPLQIEDCCYDETRDEYVIAVKYATKVPDYAVEYIVFDRRHKIVNTIQETQGVTPRFVIAPDKSVWIRLSAIHTEKAGEIVLPLYDRKRVVKEIVKTDSGTDFRFYWNGSYWGYVHDKWNRKQPDKLLQYVFDKDNLFKTRKAFKFDGYLFLVPHVQNDVLYLLKKSWDKEKGGSVCVLKATAPGKIEPVGMPVSTGEVGWCYLMNVGENMCQLLGFVKNEIYRLTINLKGELLEKKHIYSVDCSKFCNIMNFKVTKDGTAAFFYVCDRQSGSIEVNGDSVQEVFHWKDNILYCLDKEIQSTQRLVFKILTDGRQCYHMAVNMQANNGIKELYIFEK